jgi:hypothetical protein
MSNEELKKMTRGDFLRAVLRGGLLAGIGAAGWRSVGGRKGFDRSRQTCINKSVCCQCRVFRDCELPAAQSAKHAGEEFS